MADKELFVKVRFDGVSNEAAEMSKLTIQIKNMKTEVRELEKAMSSGIASKEQILRHASLTREINTQTESLKSLKRNVDTADDSLTRMRTRLIEMKKAAADGTQELNTKLTPEINKLTADISKLEQAQGTWTRNVGHYPQLMGTAAGGVNQLTSAVGGTTGAVGDAITSFATAGGAAGIFTAAIGLLANAWKTTRENIELYLQSADKLAVGPAGFERDAEKARMDARKRGEGQYAEGLRIAGEAQTYLLKHEKELTEEQRNYYQSLVKSGEQMMLNGRQIVTDTYGIKNKHEWERKYNALLMEEEKLNDEKLANETKWEELEANLVKQRAIVSSQESTTADKKQASIDADAIAIQLTKEKTEFIDRELANLNAIAEMTAKQEVYEDNINALLKERNTVQKEFFSDQIKINRLQKAAGRASSNTTVDATAPEGFEQFSKEVEDQLKYFAPTGSEGLQDPAVVAEYQKQEALKKAWDEGTQAAIENMQRNTALAKEDAQRQIDIELAKIDQKKALRDAEIELAAGLGEALHAMAGKNRELSYAALAIEKAAAIAQVVSNVSIANAKSLAMFPVTAGMPWIAINTGIGAALIARIIAETAGAAKDINSTFKQNNAQNVPKYEIGGRITKGLYVNTGGKDDTLILANKTETILTERQVAMLGGSGAMRALGVRGYEHGGYIGTQAPYIPPAASINMDQFNRVLEAFENRITKLEVHNDLNLVRSGLNELEVINTAHRT